MNEDLSKVINELKLKGYSPKTVKSYTFNIKKFIESSKKPREFILELIERGKSNETIRLSGFAIKFYLNTLKKQDPSIVNLINNLPNSKRENKLPKVLSREDIQKMILATKNLNHRLIIQIGYAAGLRISEIVNLKWEEIDFDREIIHLKRAKGKKDRVVMLSKKVKENLINLDLKKDGHVFKTNRGKKYSQRAIQKILENASKKAGIKKKVTPHMLRHSFATHLLEQGTDIRYIKDLLGHSNIETTLIYTKVSNKDISKIKSPLD
jgi:site-specific recombinase XerD